jgi:hypothetical protein
MYNLPGYIRFDMIVYIDLMFMCLQLSICFDLFYRKEKHWPPARLTLWSSGAMCKNGVRQIYLTLDECAHVEGQSPLWMSGLPCGLQPLL